MSAPLAGGDLVVAPFFQTDLRNVLDVEHSVPLDDGGLVTGRLARRSRVKVARIMTIGQRILSRPIGRATDDVLDAVRRELMALLGETTTRAPSPLDG